jgi:hypothetical protein
MVYGAFLEMPGVTEAEYRLVEKHLGPDRPTGLLAHVAGPGEEGWRILNIWESEEAFHRFRSERLVRAAGLAAQDGEFDLNKAAKFQGTFVSGEELPF